MRSCLIIYYSKRFSTSLFLQDEFPETKVIPYPDWVFAIIILLCVVPVTSIPLVALYRLIRRVRSPDRGDLNNYCNEGFEIETQEQNNRRT